MNFEPKLERLDHVAAPNGISFDCAHEHGSVCIISAPASGYVSVLGTIIASVPDLARMMGRAINSVTVELVKPPPHPASSDPMTLLLLISFSTIALAAIIRIIGVVMTFKVWVKSFIATTLRFGYCIVCLVKVLTGMSVSFLAEFLYATAADMPSDTKWAARCVRTKRMCLAIAACFRAVAGTAAPSACTSTRA